jgi:hypothetical protein
VRRNVAKLGGDFVLRVTGELSNGNNVLNVVRIGIRTDSEVLRNPPEEDLVLGQLQFPAIVMRKYTFPSSEPEAIKSSSKGFLLSGTSQFL